MFAINRDRFYPNHIEKREESTEKLPPGVYNFDIEGGMFFQRPYFKKEIFRDGLVPLKGEPFDTIFRRTNSFFKPKTLEIYKDVQVRHFIGALLYGPPGTGKTCFIDLLCQHFANTKGALTLRITDSDNLDNLKGVINLMRNGDESIMVIVLLEELDKIMSDAYGGKSSRIEKYMIDFCDGQDTPSNVLLIASTNHIDKIPDSLKNRQSRFNIVEEIDAIPQAIAKQLIEKFLPEKYRGDINISELSYKVTESKITIDQVKYIVLNMLCDDLTVEQAIEKVTTKVGGVPIPDDDEEDENG